MTNMTKDIYIFFLIGLLVGVAVTVLGGIKVYRSLKQPVNENVPKQQAIRSGTSVKEFRLSFENEQDLAFFSPTDGVNTEIASSHSTDGGQSMMVKIPAGQAFPGISWEVYGKDVMSWQDGQELVFNVYNNSEYDVNLLLKIKSGRDYPKRSFSMTSNLRPLADNEIRIPLADVESQCDLKEISYIKIFVQDPSKALVLYFDHMRIEK